MAKVLIEFVSDTRPATQGAADVQGALGKLGSKAGGIAAGGLALAAAGVAAVGAAAVAAGVQAFNLSSDINDATNSIATDLGISKESAGQFEGVMKDIFANNFGENFADIGESVAEVTRQLGSLPDAELQSVTEKTLAMRDAWGTEIGESVGAVDALMENFGLTSQEALDFVAAGMQKGLNSSDDFLDTITEYSTQFSNGGASADEFFSLMETGMQNGMLGTDKAADMFKEFRLIMTEGGPEIAEALGTISGPTEDLLGDIESGNLSIADAFQMVKDRLSDLDDPIEAQRLGVELFGTQFEDMGTQAALAIDLTTTKLGDLEGATDSMNAQYDNWPSMWEGVKRSALLALEPLGDKVFELANDLLPTIQDVFENQIIPALENFADWVANDLIPVVEDLWHDWTTVWWPAISEAVSEAWENVIKPALEKTGAFIKDTLIPTIQDLYTKWVTVWWPAISSAVDRAWAVIGPALDQLGVFVRGTLIPVIQDLYTKWVTVWWPAISTALQAAWNNVIKPALDQLGIFIRDTLIPVIQDLYTQWVTVWWPAISTALQNAWVVIETVLTELTRWTNDNLIPIIEYLYTQWVTVWWPAISAALTTAWEAMKPAIETIGAWLGDKLPAAIESAKRTMFPFIDAIKGFWEWISSKTFDFKISLPDLPEWAIPGSPIPLHTRWKDFGDYLNGNQFAFNFATSGLDEMGGGSGGIGGVLETVRTLVSQVGELADEFSGSALDRVQSLTESSSKITALIPLVFSTIDAFNARPLGDLYTSIEKVAALKLTWHTIFEHIAVIAYDMRLALDRMGSFLDSSLKITELVPKILEALDSLRDFGVVQDLAPEMNAVRHNLGVIIGHLTTAASHFSGEGLAHLEIFAKGATAGLGLIKTAVDGLNALRDFDATLDIGGVIELVAFEVARIVDALGRASRNFDGEGLGHLEIFAKSAKTAVGLAKESAEAFAAIKASVEVSLPVTAVMSWAAQVGSLVGLLGLAASHVSTELLDRLDEFATRVGSAIDLVRPASEALLDINETTKIGLTAESIGRFADNFMLVLVNLAQAFTPRALLTIGPALTRLEAIGEMIQSAVALVKPAAEAVLGIEQASGVADGPAKADAFANNFTSMLINLAQAFTPRVLLTIGPALARLEIVNGMIQAAVALVKPATDAVIGIEEASGVADAAGKAGDFASNFSMMLVRLSQAFTPRVLLTIGPALARLEIIGEMIQSAVALVKPAAEAVISIDEASGVADAQAKADTFASNFAGMVQSLAAAFTQQVINSITDGINKLSEIAEKLGQVVDLVKPAAEALIGINEASGIEDAKDKAAEFSENFSDLIGVLVVDLAAAAGNLSDADIDAAAGLAERSAELVGHVADVQSDLESIVTGDMIEIGQLEDALGNIGAAVDVAIDEANELVTGADAGSLSAVFADMLTLIISQTAAMFEAGRVLGESFTDGLRTSIENGLSDIRDLLGQGLSFDGGEGLARPGGGGGGLAAVGGGNTVIVSPGAVQLTVTGNDFDEGRMRNFMADVMRDWLQIGGG